MTNTLTTPWISGTGDFVPKYLNLPYLTEISQGNESFIPDVLTMFMEESTEFLQVALNHVNQKDFFSLRKAAHAMKPTGSYIGVESFTVLIAALEKAAPTGDIGEVNFLIHEITSLLHRLHGEIGHYLTQVHGKTRL